MIHEFAVEPEAINNWQDFRFICDQAGVEHGRLISRFPKIWAKMVMEAVDANPSVRDVERSSIVSRLQNMEKGKMIRLNRPYDSLMNDNPKNNWLQNVESQHKQNPFHAVILRQNKLTGENFLSIYDLDSLNPLWNVSRVQIVPRKAWELACCSRFLLQISREIMIIDPHFNPAEPRFTRTFEYLVTFAFEQYAPTRLELHVKDKKQDDNWWHEECLKYLSGCIPLNFRVDVCRWRERPEGDGPHARYVLTERGGIQYDYGLDEGNDDTEVSLLSRPAYEKRWNDYQKGETAAYELIDCFPVPGVKKSVTRK